MKEEYLKHLLDKGFGQIDNDTVELNGVKFSIHSDISQTLDGNTMEWKTATSWYLTLKMDGEVSSYDHEGIEQVQH